MPPAMSFDDARRRGEASAGFTLIEALAALGVTAILITAIGLVMAENVRGSRRIAQHLGLLSTLRLVETGLPDRAVLAKGSLAGEMQGFAWRVDVAPYPAIISNPRADRFWTPQAVVITVRSPSGGEVQLQTVRLTGRPPGQ